MLNLQSGDRIEVFYEDAPAAPMRATVNRLQTDRDEGMGVEIEDYAPWWIEITVDEPSDMDAKQVVLLGTDLQYHLNGRRVTLHKSQPSQAIKPLYPSGIAVRSAESHGADPGHALELFVALRRPVVQIPMISRSTAKSAKAVEVSAVRKITGAEVWFGLLGGLRPQVAKPSRLIQSKAGANGKTSNDVQSRCAYCVPIVQSPTLTTCRKSLTINGRDAGIRTRDPLTPRRI
jgi:hypothetical protein